MGKYMEIETINKVGAHMNTIAEKVKFSHIGTLGDVVPVSEIMKWWKTHNLGMVESREICLLIMTENGRKILVLEAQREAWENEVLHFCSISRDGMVTITHEEDEEMMEKLRAYFK
jgi:hypothetical protein